MATKRQERRPDAPPGVIAHDEVYTLAEFRERVGWSDHSLRTARRNGLKVIYTNGRGYVRGIDFVRYLDHAQRPGKSAS